MTHLPRSPAHRVRYSTLSCGRSPRPFDPMTSCPACVWRPTWSFRYRRGRPGWPRARSLRRDNSSIRSQRIAMWRSLELRRPDEVEDFGGLSGYGWVAGIQAFLCGSVHTRPGMPELENVRMLDNEPGVAESTAPGADGTDSTAAEATADSTAAEATAPRRTRRRATKAVPPDAAADSPAESGVSPGVAAQGPAAGGLGTAPAAAPEAAAGFGATPAA